MSNILVKLFITNYFKKNTSFFLFLIFVLFCAMSARETMALHHALMKLITGRGYGLAAFSLVCSLYAFKCITYVAGQLKAPENQFLNILKAVPNLRQAVLLARCGFGMYSPVFAYALVTVWVGGKDHHFIYAGLVFIWQLVNVVAITFFTWSTINNNRSPAKSSAAAPVKRRPRSAYTFTLQYLWEARKGNLLAIKGFSILVFQFLVLLNSNNVKMENFCFVTLLSLSAHALLPYHIVHFWERELTAVRTFPVSLAKKVSYWLVAYVALLLPELAFMLINNPDHVPIITIFSFYCLGISHLLLLTAIQYVPWLTFNSYSGVVFFLFFACMILLAAFALWWFIAAEVLIAVLLLHIFYPLFEQKPLETVH